MPRDWLPVVELFRRHDSFLLMTHIRPDADGLGSQLALAAGLKALGKHARVVIASTLPPRYRFLDPERAIIENFELPGTGFENVDAIAVLDTGTWGQLGDFGPWMQAQTKPKAVIDHHRTQDDLGGVAHVDIEAEATGRLAHELLVQLGAPITPTMANHLFMALATDTGWFRHSNTTAATHALAADLIHHGATPTALYERLYESAPLARLKLTGKALERLRTYAHGQIGTVEVYLSDYTETGAVPGDTEDLINYPRSIDGVEIALIFIEQPEGGTKVSFRARQADVSKLAEKFGGGGHKLAAGARLPDGLPIAREKVLHAAEKLLAAGGK
ncbi:MAG: DHH family phosphoesterase [Gemmataceae bacterium]